MPSSTYNIRKYFTISLALIIGFFIISACENEDNSIKEKARLEVEKAVQNSPTIQNTSPIQPLDPNISGASTVFHYICPNGHEEAGSNMQGTCSICGVALVHNQAYHQTQQQALQNQPATEPQEMNPTGVYHYTCPNGHPGANQQGNCPICGTALVHNQAYHQTMQQQPLQTQPAQTPPITTPQGPNADGEYHYTCPNGHPGSNQQGICSICSATLVHNDAYHQ